VRGRGCHNDDKVEGQGEVEIKSDGDGEPDRKSGGERKQSSQDIEVVEREETQIVMPRTTGIASMD